LLEWLNNVKNNVWREECGPAVQVVADGTHFNVGNCIDISSPDQMHFAARTLDAPFASSIRVPHGVAEVFHHAVDAGDVVVRGADELDHALKVKFASTKATADSMKRVR
jgi:hypothetical protein